MNVSSAKSEVEVLIKNGFIKNLDDLFRHLPKSRIAKVLDMNPTSFTNYKAHQPESFKLRELLVISEYLNVSLESITTIFANSISNPESKN